MSLIGKIEQRLLFNFTRWMALGVIGLLFVSIIISIVCLVNTRSDRYVSYSDIKHSLNETGGDTSKSIRESLPDIKAPRNIEKYLSGKNKPILLGWIKDFDDEQKKDFIANLSEVISQAEKKNPNKVIDFINKYKELKLRKVALNPFDKYSGKAMKAGIIILILTMIGLIGLFSLILVLLSVERNTRYHVHLLSRQNRIYSAGTRNP